MTTEHPPAAGAAGTHLEITTADGSADAYFSVPADGDGPWPGVVMFMDAFGIRPALDALADRIAAEGYAVLVPNVLYRDRRSPLVEGDLAQRLAGNRDEVFGEVMPLVQGYTREQQQRDAPAWLDFLAGRSEVAEARYGTVGYCMGARVALRIAGWHPERIAAMGGFHGGGLATEAPDSPHLDGLDARAELYFGHADNDGSNPPEQVDRLEAALVGAGVAFTSETYKDAGHGYTQVDTPAYDAAADARHWRELTALFARNLRA